MEQKKQYRSAIRSRRMIRQAFLELLREKPFERITVTDIVNRADINRSTFYAHYPDVRGMIEELMSDVINSSFELIKNVEISDIFKDPKPFLQELMAIGEENMELYRLLGKSDFAIQQVEKMKTVMLEKAATSVDIPESIRQSSAFRIQISFFIGGILNTYQQWVQGNLDCSMEEIAQQVGYLIQGLEKSYEQIK